MYLTQTETVMILASYMMCNPIKQQMMTCCFILTPILMNPVILCIYVGVICLQVWMCACVCIVCLCAHLSEFFLFCVLAPETEQVDIKYVHNVHSYCTPPENTEQCSQTCPPKIKKATCYTASQTTTLIQARIDYKLASLAFRHFDGSLPQYLFSRLDHVSAVLIA